MDTMAEIELMAQKACELNSFNTINLVGIKSKIESMLGLIGRNGIFDEYTKHDISHINQMLMLLDTLIPKSTLSKLTGADCLLIVLSIYFHDLGMLVTKREYNDRDKNDIFVNFKKEYLKDIRNRDSLKHLDEDNKERFVYQEYVRSRHGQRISDWLTGVNEELYDLEVTKIVRGMIDGLKPMFVQDIAKICVSHNEDDIDDFSKYPTKRSYGVSAQEIGNVNYAAIILRTADLLHITSDRTPSIEFRLISPTNPTSQLEWSKQSQVSGISTKPVVDAEGNVDESQQSDTLAVSGFFEDEKGYFALMEYLQYVRGQLQLSYKTNEKARKKFATQYEFPWKNINDEDVDAKDFEKRQLVFSVDQQKILDLLVGETLYNNFNVSLRELAQNAIDAVKVKQFELEKEGEKDYKPRVEVEWIPDSRELIIVDNGTGMDLDIIENHLLKVGSSRYQEPEFQKTHQGYNSISRFGIGLLSCFLVADDVDILTNMKSDASPLLLKVRKLHGRYLLKHGNEKGSNLRFFEKTGTCIRLKIRSNIDYAPLAILREWILIPQCDFTYLESGKRQTVGYTNTKELLTTSLRTKGLIVDGKSYQIFEHKDEGVDCSILLRYNTYLKEWNFVPISEIMSNNDGFETEPCGLAIEGIRIDDNTPGYKTQYLVAFVNLFGENAPRTNVARSSINSQTMHNMLETAYGGFLDVVTRQVEELSKSYSPTWASTEMNYMLNRLITNSDNRRDLLQDSRIFNEILNKQQYYLIEKDGKRQFSSLEELKSEGHFWTIESSAFQSANNLIKEVNTSNYTALSILKRLYGADSSLLANIDVTLTKNRYYNSLDDILLSNFQVAAIQLFEEYRTLNLKWDVKQKGTPDFWCTISSKVTSRGYFSQNFLFLQISDEVQIPTSEYEGIRTDFGIFIPQGSAMHQYLLDLRNTLKASSEDDESYILHCVSSFIFGQYQKGGKNSNWGNAFKEYVKHNYVGPYLSEIFATVDINELTEVCNKSAFSLYDKSRWYREKIDY